MPNRIRRENLQKLVAEHRAQLLEVLPAQEFEQEHLVGARNLPLKDLTADTAAGLDGSRPIIVYCWDSL
jgi:rhodanese-related sulfurtransferase